MAGPSLGNLELASLSLAPIDKNHLRPVVPVHPKGLAFLKYKIVSENFGVRRFKSFNASVDCLGTCGEDLPLRFQNF